MPQFFHVTSSRNRESIERHGLDWNRMGDVPGVAGSRRPEVDGVFLCRDEGEVAFFCHMNAAGGLVDVWEVSGISDGDLTIAPEGFAYVPWPIPTSNIKLSRTMPPREPDVSPHWPTTAYQSTLTITLEDGRVLSGDEAHQWLQRRP